MTTNFEKGDRVVHTLGRRGTVIRELAAERVTVAVRFDDADRASSIHPRYLQHLPAELDPNANQEQP
jgi:hypothetical protein